MQHIAELCWLCLQFEILQKALEVLQSSPDARGRAIQVVKVPTPPPLFITEEEEAGMKVRINSKALTLSFKPYNSLMSTPPPMFITKEEEAGMKVLSRRTSIYSVVTVVCVYTGTYILV